MADFYQDTSSERYRFLQLGSNRRPVVTWALLAINILVWGAMQNAGGSTREDVLLKFGAMFAPLIATGEYWRLFTAMFLHVGFTHLLFNGIGLLIFGRLVERIYGHYRFATIYVLAGLSGSVASLLFNRIAIGAGASGAIFGVLGALAAFFLARRAVLGDVARQNLTGLAVIAGINIIFGFSVPNIDNSAHIGGLLGGFALGMVLAPNFVHRSAQTAMGMTYRLLDANSLARRWWVIPAAGVVIVAGTLLATATIPDEGQAQTHVFRAERLSQQGSYSEALEEIEKALELDATSGQAYFVRGKTRLAIGDTAAARSDMGKALGLGLDPEDRSEAARILVGLGASP